MKSLILFDLVYLKSLEVNVKQTCFLDWTSVCWNSFQSDTIRISLKSEFLSMHHIDILIYKYIFLNSCLLSCYLTKIRQTSNSCNFSDFSRFAQIKICFCFVWMTESEGVKTSKIMFCFFNFFNRLSNIFRYK